MEDALRKEGKKKSVRKQLWMILLLAFFLRLAFVLTLDNSVLFGPDAGTYDSLAMGVVKNEGFHLPGYFDSNFYCFRPPLFPLFLSLVYGIVGHNFLAARLVQVVVSTLTCFLIYKLASRVFGEKAGVISALVMAMYPKFVYYSGSLSTETLFICLLALAMFYLSKSQQQGGARDLFLGGLFFGLASLTRSVIFAFLILVLLWRLILLRNKFGAMRDFLITLSAALLIMSPWIARNYIVHQRIVFLTTEGGYTFWVGHNPRATGGGECYLPEDTSEFEGLSEVEMDKLFYRKGFAYIKEHPARFWRLCWERVVRLWRLYPHAEYVELKYVIIGALSFGLLLPFAIWGMILAGKSWRGAGLFYLLFVYYTLVHAVFMAVTRYRVPLVPYIIMFASFGLNSVLGYVKKRKTHEGAGKMLSA